MHQKLINTSFTLRPNCGQPMFRAFTNANPSRLKCRMHMCMSSLSLHGGKSPLKLYLENDDLMKHSSNTCRNDIRLLLQSKPKCNCASTQNRTSWSMLSDGSPRCRRQILSKVGLLTNSFPTKSRRQWTSKSLQRQSSIMSRVAHPATCLDFLATLARACNEGRYRARVNVTVSGRFRKDVIFLGMIDYQRWSHVA